MQMSRYRLWSARQLWSVVDVRSRSPDDARRRFFVSCIRLSGVIHHYYQLTHERHRSSAPAFLLGFVLLSLVYYRDAKLFSTSAREFRRLDSISKSPLFSIYGEAISGVACIRAFGASARFLSLMLAKASTNTGYYWWLWGTNRWLSVRFSLLSAVVVALTA